MRHFSAPFPPTSCLDTPSASSPLPTQLTRPGTVFASGFPGVSWLSSEPTVEAEQVRSSETHWFSEGKL